MKKVISIELNEQNFILTIDGGDKVVFPREDFDRFKGIIGGYNNLNVENAKIIPQSCKSCDTIDVTVGVIKNIGVIYRQCKSVGASEKVLKALENCLTDLTT